MKIHASQTSVFRRAAEQRFVDAMVAHANEHFPSRCASFGVGGTREAIAAGIQRALAHGFRAERHLCKYLNLVFTFGASFDADLSWAREILRDTVADDPAVRLSLLDRAARAYLSRFAGD